jgi:DNA-binding FadR family transcriptional regulator
MNTRLESSNSEAGILARLIQARQELSQEAANYLLSLRFDDSDVARMNELSERARLGQLAETDAAELDSYIHVANLLAVIQSRARRALRSPAPNSH